MNKKTKTLLSLIGFTLFIAIAVFAYNKLGRQVKPGSALNVIDPQPQATAEATTAMEAAATAEASATPEATAEPEKTEQAVVTPESSKAPAAAEEPARTEEAAQMSAKAEAEAPEQSEATAAMSETPQETAQAEATEAAQTAKEQAAETERPRTKAPDFTVQDADGKAVKLSDFLGKPIVLNFWASWCPPCKGEMPEFNEVYQQVGGDVQFMMVDLVDGSRETKEKGAKYVADMGFEFPVFFDMDQSVAMTYGVASIPTTYFIDAEGYLVAGAQSAIDAATLMQGIGMIQKK